MKRTFLFLLLLIAVGRLAAQSAWADRPEAAIAPVGPRYIVPSVYRTVQLDLPALQPVLTAAPERFKPEAADNQTLLTLPMPDGSWQSFRLYESPVMAPALQEKYPEIRCYTGEGIDNPQARLKCDLTPWGFHAMVRTPGQSTVFIDPYSHGDTENYIVYFKKDFHSKKSAGMQCSVETDLADLTLEEEPQVLASSLQGDCMLRQYRLALACTGEYATFHGGTKPLVLAAMNTSMNRVNGVYEEDLSITMQIIANNDLIIYLNAGSDPYTNNNGGTMLGQNQTTCDNVIGTANYDMGHVFSTGGGGIASLQSVCSAGSKARGVTGGGAPIGDPFDIDYVAHEMGHQFGANHTQNNNCNSVASASMEPGSASTIMGYAGICSPNVQNNSDDYFHAISLQEIGAFVTGSFHTCPVEINTGNNAPTVNAGPNYNIPKSTPFALTATGSDPDGDPLNYCWEQMNPQAATMPPVSTSTVGPLFRSYEGVSSPTRWFPRLPDLVANVNSTWEELPGVARTLNFRVTARDKNSAGGCTEEDDVVLTVAGTAGPFLVSEPNTNVLWYVGDNKTVTWDVASTNLAPINCANVRILLSTDGGFTYPVTLLASTPNDGSADIVVPNNVSTTCRVMVQSVGNVFFDISNVNFRIQIPPTPTFTLTAPEAPVSACAGETTSFDLSLASLAGFASPVQITVTGAPAGATVEVSPNPATPSTTATVSLSDITPAMAGNYTLTVTAVSGAITQTATVQLVALPGIPAGFAALSLPADGSTGVALVTSLEWEAVPVAENYLVEVATNPSFDAGSIFYTTTTSGTTANLAGLTPNTVYYWRVKAENDCGSGDYSAAAAFLTANLNCNLVFSATDVPQTLDDATVNTAVSIIDVPISGSIGDVNVTVQADHTWVGDLSAVLTSPSGTNIQLFDRPGVPASNFGCSGDNVALSFDDEATQTAAELEGACNATAPALSGAYQAIMPLSGLDAEELLGEWTLAVTDNYAEDGGALVSWSISVCLGGENLEAALLTNAALTVQAGATGEIGTTYLEAALTGTAAQGVYTVLVLPESGQLLLNGTPLGVGSTFTQADIDAGNLSYENDGSPATTDNFHFDFIDQNDGAWLHGGIFNINVIQNSLVVSAAQTADLDCSGDDTGAITVTVNGGTAPLTYSLNGGDPQSGNVFSGLPAGTYTVVVTDDIGFTATTNEVVIADPLPITASASVDEDDVTVTAFGGSGALEYSLDGQNFQPENTFTDLANGVYTITVRDPNGCTTTVTAIVAVNTLLAALELQAGIACHGDLSGAVFVTVGGGQAPYEYVLNGGDPQSTNVFTGLAAGTYTVVVTDDNGFSATTNALVLSEPSAIAASADVDLATVTVTASGGTGVLQYSLDGENFDDNAVFTGLENGEYTITVQDENGCTATATATVDVPVLTFSVAVTPNDCAGDSDASITITVAGGAPPYEYSIDGGLFQSGNVFTGLEGGSHTVTVKDQQGNNTSTITINDPAAISASATAVLNTITVTATGGTGALEYSLNGINFQPGNLFLDQENGEYTITVRDENGCTATASVTVEVAALTVTAVTIDAPTCNGGTDGELTVTAVGGIPPYEYSLNNGPWQSSNVFTGLASGAINIRVRDAEGTIVEYDAVVTQPSAISVTANVLGNDVTLNILGGTAPYSWSLPSLTNLPNGNYTTTVTDANGCTASVSFTINYTPLSVSVTPIGDPCLGNAFLVEAMGGVSPYQYVANNGTPQSSPQFSNLPPGSYTFKVIDAAGETFTVPVAMVVVAPLTATATSDANGIVTVSTSGGTGPFEYMINGTTQTDPVFLDLPNGTYTVVVTGSNGCTATTTVTVMTIGIVEPGQAWGLSVAPNPSQGLFRLSMFNAPAATFRADVFDASGRWLLSRTFDVPGGAYTTTLDLLDLPQGLYLLRLTDGKDSGAVRVSVVR